MAVMETAIRTSAVRRPDRAAAVEAGRFARRHQRGFADTTARRHGLHHPRRQRRHGVFVADPAGALDGRLGLRRRRLRLDLGAAARQHDGFRNFGVGAKAHSGVSRRRRRCEAARLPVGEPLDDRLRFRRSYRRCWQVLVRLLSPRLEPATSCRSISVASRCRLSSSPTPRTALRARTTGCGSA